MWSQPLHREDKVMPQLVVYIVFCMLVANLCGCLHSACMINQECLQTCRYLLVCGDVWAFRRLTHQPMPISEICLLIFDQCRQTMWKMMYMNDAKPQHVVTLKHRREVIWVIIAPKTHPPSPHPPPPTLPQLGSPFVLHPNNPLTPPHRPLPACLLDEETGQRGLFMSCCSQSNYWALMRLSGISQAPLPCHLSQVQEKYYHLTRYRKIKSPFRNRNKTLDRFQQPREKLISKI